MPTLISHPFWPAQCTPLSNLLGRRHLLTSDITRTCHLYRVKHSPEYAHIAELMSSMELHRHLGHIGVTSTRKLVQSRAIKGIKLDPNAPETDCEACIFAHAMCLPILYTSHISARQPKASGIRSTLMSGGPHPSQLQRVCATLSPS